jgi:hypothetical protein
LTPLSTFQPASNDSLSAFLDGDMLVLVLNSDDLVRPRLQLLNREGCLVTGAHHPADGIRQAGRLYAWSGLRGNRTEEHQHYQ